jgi:hypothetical protein
MDGLKEGYKKPYSQQAGCIISLARKRGPMMRPLMKDLIAQPYPINSTLRTTASGARTDNY